ncbi:MAG: AbgT family transporter [Bacteroidales bacterium]|nr:AbgT family transporter [Bacteroidales bacterium]
MSFSIRKFSDRTLSFIEKAGNKLPHPATLFFLFAISVPLLSLIAHLFSWNAIHPATKELIQPVNLISKEGLHMIILNMVTNFTGFAPLGVVLVAMLGIGIAEESGLISSVVRLLVLSSPGRILTFIIVLTGVLSNVASDVGYVLLIPLAGVIFIAFGRHPIVGMAAAFAGVSGGFSANLVLGTIDPLLAGLSEEAAHIIDPTYSVNPTANYFFMVASTFFITAVGTFITEKIIEPRFEKEHPFNNEELVDRISSREKTGLRNVFYTLLIIIALVLAGLIPRDSLLRGINGDILSSPVIKGVVAFIFIVGAICGIVFGLTTGRFKNDTDVMKGMENAMTTLASYLVLVFFAAQFVAFFKWSNLGIIFAIKGAAFLTGLNAGLIPLLILFVILAATINMFMGSASAKWALLAPVFVPMFMIMGYSPELSQVVYRIGDSVTNIISPMMSFFVLIIAFFQKYDKNAGMGTIISTMLPFSIGFFIIWTILLIIWIKLGLPLGPGVSLHYEFS